MRVLTALGAAVFIYLGLIPAGLIYSTLDSACAGEACSASLLSRIAFTCLYAACLLALLGTAALLADYTRRGTIEAQERIPPALAACGATSGSPSSSSSSSPSRSAAWSHCCSPPPATDWCEAARIGRPAIVASRAPTAGLASTAMAPYGLADRR